MLHGHLRWEESVLYAAEGGMVYSTAPPINRGFPKHTARNDGFPGKRGGGVPAGSEPVVAASAAVPHLSGTRPETALPVSIDWKPLWDHVERQFPCDPRSVHGPDHWRRVERNGLLVCSGTGAVPEVVRLFALFHDSRREHDGYDVTHGARGAELAASLRGVLFDVSDAHLDLLQYACTWHTHGDTSVDPTIGACWDADRLDLGRVGITPSPRFMSTELGRRIAEHGSIEPFL